MTTNVRGQSAHKLIEVTEIYMMKNIFSILCFCCCAVSMHSHAKEACDPYRHSGGCLGQPVHVLDGLGFMTDPMQSPYYQLLRTFPNKNPLGLHVIIYTKDDLICAVRYSRSTGKYSINLNEFDGIKNGIMAYYDDIPWIEHAGDSVYRGAKVYNDGIKRINVTRHHVIFVDLSGCG